MSETLWTALLQVQGELGAVAKDARADSGTRHRYASLGAVLDAARPALWRAGIVLTQDTTSRPEIGLVEVHTHLVHAATGERTTSSVAVAPTGPQRKDGAAVLTEPQQVGVAISYARRYGVLCALGLATTDDEGLTAPASKPAPSVAPSVADTPASASDPLAPRKAALDALAERLSIGEVQRRLGIIATAAAARDAGSVQTDGKATTRERIGEAMAGTVTAWRSLSDADFVKLVDAIHDWPVRL